MKSGNRGCRETSTLRYEDQQRNHQTTALTCSAHTALWRIRCPYLPSWIGGCGANMSLYTAASRRLPVLPWIEPRNGCLIGTERCSKIGLDMNTVSRFVIPNPKVCFINVRTCFASPYDMNCPLATLAHMQKKSYNTALLLTNTCVHPARVDQLVNAVVLGAGCWSSRRIKSHPRAFRRECDWTEIILLTYNYKL